MNYLNRDFLIKLIFWGKGAKILDPRKVCVNPLFCFSDFCKGVMIDQVG